ncbi:MAG: HEAT repeat domain-containing protein [Terriglobia bacterium]
MKITIALPFLLAVFLPGLVAFSSPSAQKGAAGIHAEPGGPDCGWAPALLYAILTSPNAAAQDSLYDAAFAAGPPLVPELQGALGDDRTAEFAAQSLAFIGGDKALGALEKLMIDPRDLNLRRFYYGALGEFDTPQANETLLNVIRNANQEPDRTVTEAAIIALTARSDAKLVPPLERAESKLTDPVIQDDLENAISIIKSRSRYLDSMRDKTSGTSLSQTVRAYFLPATSPATAIPVSHGERPLRARDRERATGVHVKLLNIAFTPGRMRALAHVLFENAAAIADYRIVLEQQQGKWTVASVWLDDETEKSTPAPH